MIFSTDYINWKSAWTTSPFIQMVSTPVFTPHPWIVPHPSASALHPPLLLHSYFYINNIYPYLNKKFTYHSFCIDWSKCYIPTATWHLNCVKSCSTFTFGTFGWLTSVLLTLLNYFSATCSMISGKSSSLMVSSLICYRF